MFINVLWDRYYYFFLKGLESLNILVVFLVNYWGLDRFREKLKGIFYESVI